MKTVLDRPCRVGYFSAAMTHPALNPRQEAFIGHIVKGCSNRQAYQKVYAVGDRVADANAARMLAEARVKSRLAELQAKAADKAAVTAETIAAELDAAYMLAFDNKQAAACVAASLGKAKLFGLLIDKSQVETARDKPAPFRPGFSNFPSPSGSSSSVGSSDGPPRSPLPVNLLVVEVSAALKMLQEGDNYHPVQIVGAAFKQISLAELTNYVTLEMGGFLRRSSPCEEIHLDCLRLKFCRNRIAYREGTSSRARHW